MATLAGAFEDNDAAAAAVGIEGSEASLVVLVPPVSALPERRPTGQKPNRCSDDSKEGSPLASRSSQS
jgi:hypothetical protein